MTLTAAASLMAFGQMCNFGGRYSTLAPSGTWISLPDSCEHGALSQLSLLAASVSALVIRFASEPIWIEMA